MGDTLVLRGSSAVRDGAMESVNTAGGSEIFAGRPTPTRSIALADVPGPVPMTPDAEADGRLTLTRRGRLLLIGLPVALGIVLLIVLGAFLTSKAQADEGPAQTSPTISVTVGAGETLWGLASQHAPDRDPRDVVAEMVELNDLSSSVVQAGQSISIPSQG